ncbi:hypothetical protein FB471_2429 [Amycolatopsis cihanbeyliensis]|uniref:Uncharacterized protein n=1 Tax=Amycolatopsis cihanbeyliensis TaxID=1128664 RepID=A0A542DHX3_AMYCI|nr:hypothetical protein FB471_2429 [Amycolatopsis cihanbeyliensis]
MAQSSVMSSVIRNNPVQSNFRQACGWFPMPREPAGFQINNLPRPIARAGGTRYGSGHPSNGGAKCDNRKVG